MNFYVLTLFPDMIMDGINHSIIKNAMNSGAISISCINIRDFAFNKHKHVDDYPYGGGAGMVLMPAPVFFACDSVKSKLTSPTRVVYMTPKGAVFNQAKAAELAAEEDLIILCGHYEGVDERVIEEIVTDEISIGDYVLTGGELAAMVVIDAVSRLVPNVLNKNESHEIESFSDGLLEYPQYTRPYEFMGRTVPDVLLSGNHKKIDEWRKQQSLAVTRAKRPDLLDGKNGKEV